MGNLSQMVSFFSDFPPLSYEFHTFFLHFPLDIFGIFSHFPIATRFPPFFSILFPPPFPPISPHFPISPIFLYLCGQLANLAAANADACHGFDEYAPPRGPRTA